MLPYFKNLPALQKRRLGEVVHHENLGGTGDEANQDILTPLN